MSYWFMIMAALYLIPFAPMAAAAALNAKKAGALLALQISLMFLTGATALCFRVLKPTISPGLPCAAALAVAVLCGVAFSVLFVTADESN